LQSDISFFFVKIFPSTKMKKIKIFNYCCFFFLCISCQNTEPKNPWPDLSYKKRQEQQKEKIKHQIKTEDSIFLAYINENIITHPDEKKYISDIALLKSIQLINCDSKNIHYKDKVDGKEIELKLSLKRFEKKDHKIQYENREKFDPNNLKFIDGKQPWGIYREPVNEIDQLQIWVNGNEIKMEEEIKDIYNLDLCELDHKWKNFDPNPLLKYDEENKVFYLYLKGGKTSYHFFGKFIFNENKFIKRYMLNYGDLSPTGSFRPNFKGF